VRVVVTAAGSPVVITVAGLGTAAYIGWQLYQYYKSDNKQVRDAARQVGKEPNCRPPEADDFNAVHKIIESQKGPDGKVPWDTLMAGGSMQIVDTQCESKTVRIRQAFQILIGLKLGKSSNIFATRLFHFYAIAPQNEHLNELYVLVVECPWRIERANQIFVGSEDYSLPATDNDDPGWQSGTQSGHLQDQKLRELMGELEHGEIFNTGDDFVVKSVEADALGGFRIGFSGAYILSVFPSSGIEMEWMLRRPPDNYLALMNGHLHGTL
jgi:hypothetical protein